MSVFNFFLDLREVLSCCFHGLVGRVTLRELLTKFLHQLQPFLTDRLGALFLKEGLKWTKIQSFVCVRSTLWFTQFFTILLIQICIELFYIVLINTWDWASVLTLCSLISLSLPMLARWRFSLVTSAWHSWSNIISLFLSTSTLRCRRWKGASVWISWKMANARIKRSYSEQCVQFLSRDTEKCHKHFALFSFFF